MLLNNDRMRPYRCAHLNLVLPQLPVLVFLAIHQDTILCAWGKIRHPEGGFLTEHSSVYRTQGDVEGPEGWIVITIGAK